MDESKKYIDMCSKAVEIQKKWWTGCLWGNTKIKKASGKVGDYYYDNAYKIQIKGVGSGTYCKEPVPIWLPRQDQLQKFTDKDASYIVSRQAEKINEFYNKCPEIVNTWEKLWLCYVMKEKYKKEWINNNWKIKENE